MSAEIVVVAGPHRGTSVRLDKNILVGRSQQADLSLSQDKKASGRHARILALGNERFILEDLDSTNGCYVNDERLLQVVLRSGDRIKIGRSVLVFRRGGSLVSRSRVVLRDGGSLADVPLERRTGLRIVSPKVLAARLEAEEGADARARVERPDPVARLLRSGELEARRAIDEVLRTLLQDARAEWVYLFLRQPLSDRLLCEAELSAGPKQPSVERALLARGLEGEVALSATDGVAPVLVQGRQLGVVYVDGKRRGALLEQRRQLAETAGRILGLLIASDRRRRLASAGLELARLQLEPPTLRSARLDDVVQDLDRLLGAAAQQRGLRWELVPPASLLCLTEPRLLTRGLEKLMEHVLVVAEEGVSLTAVSVEGGRRAHIVLQHDGWAPRVTPEAPLLHPDGPLADLERAEAELEDGTLALARACLERAGATLRIEIAQGRVLHLIELEAGAA